MQEFISTFGYLIGSTILTAVMGFIGTWIGKVYKERVNDKTKAAVVKTCVKAVEQIYKDLHGQEKYDKAVEGITAMLAEKGITITNLELKMLIEACCGEFVKAVKEEINDGNSSEIA